jgi:hypothetical protein
MAKIYYGEHYGAITVRADDEPPARGDIELTPEQAIAGCILQVARALMKISEGLTEISQNLPRK